MRFNHDDSDDLALAAATVLQTHPHAVLATADKAGRPWAVPVHQQTDSEGVITWRSSPDTRHSQNLSENPQMSVLVYSANDDRGNVAVYLEGTGRMQGRQEPPPGAPEDAEEINIYAFTPTAAWFNDDTFTKTPLDLDLIRAKLAEDAKHDKQ